MSADIENGDGLEQVEAFVPKDYDLMDIFEELSFLEKFKKVTYGLKQPKDSGDYKYAILQVIRLSGPLAAIVVPILFLGILVVFASIAPPPPRPVEVKIMEPEPIEELDDIEEIKPEDIEPPDPMEVNDVTPDIDITNPTPSPETDFSPQPAEFDSVALVKSPVIMKGIYGSRTPGARGTAMRNYGGSGATEGAVMRALRWLKKNQAANGSWDKPTGMEGAAEYGSGGAAAHTAVGLLTFLAHGETPASEEFGATVEKAIRFLVDGQQADGTFASKDGHNYTQPIVSYALSEAYALTKVPVLKETAQKAVQMVITGQHPNGGWDYNCAQTERDDTSYMGWCAQSLKAAKMAGLENDGLEKAYKNAPNGFKKNFASSNDGASGGFGYTEPSANHGLTGVGTLCMQLTGASKAMECRKGLMGIKNNSRVSWDDATRKGGIYYWYYDTQAMFHAGGDLWNEWNKEFAPAMVKAQVIIKGAIADPKGKMQDIGYWPTAGEPKHLSRSFETCLCALSLQVYYRYLPTYKPPEKEEEAEAAASDDVEIEIQI